MGDLLAALRAIASAGLYPLPAGELLGRTATLVAARNMIDAQLARTVRRAELTRAPEHDGRKSMATWLRGHCRLSPAAAGRLVRAGRTLEALPAVAAGRAAGAVTADQVEVLAPIVAPANRAAADAQGVDPAAVDELLAGVAATRPYADLAQVVHHYLARLDPHGPEPDPTEGRSLVIGRHADGATTGRWELDPVGSEKVRTALESIVQGNRPAGDTRTRAQQLADALVQLCDNVLAAGTLPFLRTVRPHLLVQVAAEDLADPAPGHGAYGLRRHRFRRPRPRDRLRRGGHGCVFAGCQAPTYWCEVHHLREWIFGGQTSLENSGLLCERHHTQVHHGFRVERQPHGRWRTRRPDGSEILVLHPVHDDRPTTRAG